MMDDLLKKIDLIVKKQEAINTEVAKRYIYSFYDVFEEEITEESINYNKKCVLSYGEFLIYLFEQDVIEGSDLITLTLEYLEICVRNFDSYKDVIFVDNLEKIHKLLLKRGNNNFVVTTVHFYIVQFRYMSCMYLSHSIKNQENGFDTGELVKIYNSYKESNKIYNRRDHKNAFIDFYKALSEEEFIKYFDDIYDIVDTYVEVNEMISNIALLTSFNEIREVSFVDYQINFIDNYILDYAPSIIKHFKETKNIKKINELYNLISSNFRNKDEVFKEFML